MQINVIEVEDGEPHVLWGKAVMVTCVLAVFTSGGALGAYYLLTGTTSWAAAFVGAAGTVTAVVSGIRKSLRDLATKDHA
jgi:hypothetical protein